MKLTLNWLGNCPKCGEYRVECYSCGESLNTWNPIGVIIFAGIFGFVIGLVV